MKVTKVSYKRYKALCDNLPKKDAMEYLDISSATVARLKGSKDYKDYRELVDNSNGKRSHKSKLLLTVSITLNIVLLVVLLTR